MSAMLEVDGFTVVEDVLPQLEITSLIQYVEAALRPAERRGGLRNLLRDERMSALVRSRAILDLVLPVLGCDCFAVRGILFDKTPGANWKVPWHQDVTIAVHARQDVAGYGPWSIKEGVVHVQPPAAVLERMLTVRLHLDDCPEENGALRVLPGTHTSGKLGEARINARAREQEHVVCEVGSGGALLMRPLLIHASSAVTMPGHRRVLHFDFAADKLPPELRWAACGGEMLDLVSMPS